MWPAALAHMVYRSKSHVIAALKRRPLAAIDEAPE